MAIVLRMARAGNGMPVFTTSERSAELKRPFGATWDAERSLWMYPAYFPVASKVLADFEVLGRTTPLALSESVQEYIKELAEVEKRYKNLELPAGFEYVTKPYAHQVLGLCHVFYMSRAALFFDPGLGKSKVAIDWARLLRFTGYRDLFVVMGPLTTIRNWGKEIDRHSGGQLTWGAMLGTPKQKLKVIDQAAAREFDILLVTYDTARNFVDQIFNKVPYAAVVLDESHLVKDWTASRTKSAFELVQKTTRRLLMTGTPTLGNPMDLYGQFKILGDYFMPEPWHIYASRYLVVAEHNKHLVLGYKNLSILNARTTFLSLRRTKAECLDLPPQTFVDVDVDLARGQIVAINELIDAMGLDVTQLDEYLRRAVAGDNEARGFLQLPHVATLLIKLLQIAAGFLITSTADPRFCDSTEPGGCKHMADCVAANIKPYTKKCLVVQDKPPDKVEFFKDNPKLDALEELLNSLLGNPANKAIVWCYFQAEMNLVAERLEERKISFVRVDGKTGSKIQSLVDRFNEDPSIQVYLGQISTGVGITLNAANYTVYYSLTFNLGSYLQSLDRNYRIGQERNVTVYRLLCRNTIEHSLVKLLENKVDVDTALTIEGETTDKMSRVVTKPQLMNEPSEPLERFDDED